MAYIGEVAAICTVELGCGRHLLLSGCGSYITITDIAAPDQELCRRKLLAHTRIHGIAAAADTAAAAAGSQLLVVAAWGQCELKVLWLLCGSSGCSSNGGSNRDPSCAAIQVLHEQQLPRCQHWVLDAALLLLPPAAGPHAGSAGSRGQLQQQQLPALQLLALLLDNSVDCLLVRPANSSSSSGVAGAGAGADGSCNGRDGSSAAVVHGARVASSSRTSLYSGALLLQPGAAARGAAADTTAGQQLGPAAADVWVASGTAFGQLLVWQLPSSCLSAALPAPAADGADAPPQQANGGVTTVSVTAPVSFQLQGHEGAIHRVTWGPVVSSAAAGRQTSTGSCDGGSSGGPLQLLGSCSDDRTARVWQLPLGRHAQPAAAAAAQVGQVLGPSVTLWGHTARLWDVALLQLPAIVGVADGTTAADGSSGSSGSGIPGVIAATASEDSSCRLWDLQRASQLDVLQGHSGRGVWRCRFTGAGSSSRSSCALVTAGADAAVKLWPLGAWLLRLQHQQQQQSVPRSIASASRPEQQSQQTAQGHSTISSSSSSNGSSNGLQPESLPPAGGSRSGVIDSSNETVKAIGMPRPDWLLAATSRGRLGAVRLPGSGNSSSSIGGSSSGTKVCSLAVAQNWIQLYSSRVPGPFMAMALLPDSNSNSSSSSSSSGGSSSCTARVALGHLRGLAAVLDVMLPRTTPDAAAAAGVAANTHSPPPDCLQVAVWQAYGSSSQVTGVFGAAALGPRTVITSAAVTTAAAAKQGVRDGSSSSKVAQRERPLTRLWLLSPVDAAGGGQTKQKQGAQPLLLAEAASPFKAAITAAEVVVLPPAAGAAAAAAAAVLVLGSENGDVITFSIPGSCWAAAMASHQFSRQQQQHWPSTTCQLQLLHRFKAAHGTSHISLIQPGTAGAGAQAGFSTAGRDGCMCHYRLHVQAAAAAAAAATAEQQQQQQEDQQQQAETVGVVLAATEKLPACLTTVRHVISWPADRIDTAHAGKGSAAGGTLGIRPGPAAAAGASPGHRLLLGFHAQQCVVWDASTGTALLQVDCSSMRRPYCFWARGGLHGSSSGADSSSSSSSREIAGCQQQQQQQPPLLMFAYVKEERVHVASCFANDGEAAPAAAAPRTVSLAGEQGQAPGAPAAAADATASLLAVPVSISNLLGGHHGREILASVTLPGPAAAAEPGARCSEQAAAGGGGGSSSSSPGGSCCAVLTGSEDGTVRAIVVQQQQQQQQQEDATGVCGGLQLQQSSVLAAHAAGVAVRCLAAAPMPAAAAETLRREQQQQQQWIVVAGCARGVLLVWRVGWQAACPQNQQRQQQQEQQQQPTGGWQLQSLLLGSKVPAKGLRPCRHAASSYSAAADGRTMALAVVMVHQRFDPPASPVSGNDEAASAAAARGVAEVLIAAAMSDGSLELLRLSLPEAAWQAVAVLHDSSGSSSFAHIPVALASAELPWPLLPASGTSSGSIEGGRAAVNPGRCHLLAAGTSDGCVLFYDVTRAVESCRSVPAAPATPAAAAGFTDVRKGSSSSGSSSGALGLLPLLQLPGLHQSGVNDMVLQPLTSFSARSTKAGKQPQQQQLLLITAGDDQAVAVVQLELAASAAPAAAPPAAAAAAVVPSVVAQVRQGAAHWSAVRGLLVTCETSSGSLVFLTVGLDQRVVRWRVSRTAQAGEQQQQQTHQQQWHQAAGGSSAAAGGLRLQQLGWRWTEVPEPEALSGLLQQPAGSGAGDVCHGVLAVAGRGLELMQL